MKIGALYSFNRGREIVEAKYPAELAEITDIIDCVDSTVLKTKISREKTMPGKALFSPKALNVAFKAQFFSRGWQPHKEPCEYSREYYLPTYTDYADARYAFREMDFVKNKLGVEVQFGKYAFMVYNVAAKMTIFRKKKVIKAGVEIVALKHFADEMSTGVSYFEQIAWDLDNRGTSNIDTPVLIIGVTI
jgi:hypothetical protein